MDKGEINSLINSIPKEIRTIYYMHRDAFFNFGIAYGIDRYIMADIYQEAFLVLRKHAIKGRLVKVDSSLKTYLFGIGKRMIFNYHKQHKNIIPLEPKLHIVDKEIEEIDFDTVDKLTVEQKLLRTFFNMLGKRCQEMLTLFYYRGLTINEIAEKSGYENANVVSSQKSRCIRRLKEMINTRNK